MDMFRRLAVFTLARDAGFVTLAASTFMVGFSFEPALAFSIGAHIALIFSIALLTRAAWLTEESIIHTEPWRVLERDERPADAAGRSWARGQFRELLLQFARSAAGVAVALYTLSLFASIGRVTGDEHGVLTASLN